MIYIIITKTDFFVLYRYKAASDALTKRKEQLEKSEGRGGRGGARGGRGVVRGSHKPIGRSYQAAMQSVRRKNSTLYICI